MAGAGAKLFTSGSVLTAAQVNTYLMDTDSVQVYDGSAWVAIGGGADILQVQVFS